MFAIPCQEKICYNNVKLKGGFEMAEKLIAFYSRNKENYVNGNIVNLEIGNTEIIANIIREITSADFFKIEQINPYSDNYNLCISQAQSDQKLNARPELVSYLDNCNNYKTIYLGFPNYWGTMPMAIFTFLEHYDFNGKIIKPFCTHEGSGFGNSLHDIEKICPNAKITTGIAIKGSNVYKCKDDIISWI